MTLTVTDNDGGDRHDHQDGDRSRPTRTPTAAFTSSVNKLAVGFDGSARPTPTARSRRYAWDFGDGATSTGASRTTPTPTAATYTVTLTVTDNEVAPTRHQDGDRRWPTPTPTAAFTSTVNKLAVSFDGSGSTDSDGTVASYAWDFGDGATSTVAEAEPHLRHGRRLHGELTVTDNDGATDTITKTVTAAANAKPTAAFTSTVNKLAVSFDGSGSTDSDGTVACYAWDFGDGATSTGQKPTHTYATAGDSTVS